MAEGGAREAAVGVLRGAEVEAAPRGGRRAAHIFQFILCDRGYAFKSGNDGDLVERSRCR
jgi:hypothetical protein